MHDSTITITTTAFSRETGSPSDLSREKAVADGVESFLLFTFHFLFPTSAGLFYTEAVYMATTAHEQLGNGLEFLAARMQEPPLGSGHGEGALLC